MIDEGKREEKRESDNNSDPGDEVPQCQGCNQKTAQFVCAGCGNQWYCSRDCQVSSRHLLSNHIVLDINIYSTAIGTMRCYLILKHFLIFNEIFILVMIIIEWVFVCSLFEDIKITTEVLSNIERENWSWYELEG